MILFRAHVLVDSNKVNDRKRTREILILNNACPFIPSSCDRLEREYTFAWATRNSNPTSIIYA